MGAEATEKPAVVVSDERGVRSSQWLRSALMGQLLVGAMLAAAAMALRWLLDPLLGARQPFTPAYGLVALAVWYGGWRAALTTLVLCHLAATYWFVSPRGQWTWSAQEAVGSATYYVIGGIIVFLGHRATSANRALRQALEKLHRSDERRSRFLAVLAHELRNPLAVVATALELLGSEKADARTRSHTIGLARRQVKQTSHLIDDLLDVTRIDQGKIALRLQTVQVATLVDEAVDAVRAFSQDRGQFITVRLPQDAVTLQADGDRLSQVLVNLLQNASKFSPRGGDIELQVTASADEVVFCVRDSGVGIAADRVESIFEPFVQIDTPGHRGDGLGLGLWLVREIVRLHGGSITAESHGPGQGAIFTAWLPRR